MANITSYIKWRGDLTFEERPFNLIDNLVICNLAYTDLSSIIQKEQKTAGITIAAAIQRRLEGKDPKEIADYGFLYALKESRRYQELKLLEYQDILAHDQTQFAAVTIQLAKDQYYVVFRGTDTSIIGWKEDFSSSYEITNAQELSITYLQKIMDQTNGEIYVGGHSKGGNLALYSVVHSQHIELDRIKKIFCNDSPGICPEFLNKSAYEKIRDRIIKIVPEFCVIGALFDQGEPDYIVCSSASHILQHDLVTWEVEGTQLVCTDQIDPGARQVNEIFDEWIENASMNERKAFTDELFQAFGAGGAKFFTEIVDQRGDGFEAIVSSMIHSDRKAKAVIKHFFVLFFEKLRKKDLLEMIKDKRMIQALGFFLLGLIFVCIPAVATRFLGSIMYSGICVYASLKLWKVYQNYREEQKIQTLRAAFWSMILFGMLVGILTGDVVRISIDLMMAILFFYRSTVLIRMAIDQKKHRRKSWWTMALEAFVTLGMGVALLAVSKQNANVLVLTAGAYLIYWSMVIFIKDLWETA